MRLCKLCLSMFLVAGCAAEPTGTDTRTAAGDPLAEEVLGSAGAGRGFGGHRRKPDGGTATGMDTPGVKQDMGVAPDLAHESPADMGPSADADPVVHPVDMGPAPADLADCDL